MKKARRDGRALIFHIGYDPIWLDFVMLGWTEIHDQSLAKLLNEASG